MTSLLANAQPRVYLRVLRITLLAVAASATTVAQAGNTPIAFTSRTPELSSLVACLTDQLAADGPVMESSQLTEGLEFRLSLETRQDERLITITGLLKPNPGALEPYDDDPEAHVSASARFYRMLRVHVGTRAWKWRDTSAQMCHEAVAWISPLRMSPLFFDRLTLDQDAAAALETLWHKRLADLQHN